MTNIPINYSVRLGIVKSVGNNFIDFQFIDQLDDQTFRAPIPHPYAGRGGGIFTGIEKDSLVLVSSGIGEKWYCVATVPDYNFYFNLDGASNIKYNESQYPELKEGEISVKGNTGQYIELKNSGNIALDAGVGNSYADIELSNSSKALFKRISQEYSFSESGRSIDGIIKRDLREEENKSYTDTTNFLDSESYDLVLSEIGRFPQNKVQNRTTSLIKRTFRNPALVEKRSVVYEYADSFNVQSFDKEVKSLQDTDIPSINTSIDVLQSDISARKNRRTDVLNLNGLNYNHLIEKIEGNVVDIYGNLLDINRNVIRIPEIDTIESTGSDNAGLGIIYDHHRRSIKLHYEINSRKPITDSEAPEVDKTRNNARNFSRWSIDVDGEGLTKINIPSSSETGNIPVLGRYFNSRDPNDKERGSYKDDNRIDVRLQQFGAKSSSNASNFSGTEIKNENYLPRSITGTPDFEQVIQLSGTAFHDINNIANSILTGGKFKNTSSNTSPVSEYVINKIASRGEVLDEQPNAGGRSVHANLDGSFEMSIGADTIDRKSIVIDTAGGAIIHMGRDKNGRSVVQQTDGDILIEVGGKGISTDSRFKSDTDTEDRPGRIEIHLSRPNGTPQKIIIDESGMTFDVQGGMYFKSSGDMVFDSGARMLLHAKQISNYGSGDIDERAVDSSETKIRRKGRGIG